MGDDAYERAATDDEVDRMGEVLREAMLAGAAGFASSFAPTHRGADGKPIPSRLAERSEIESLLGVVGETRRGIVAMALGEPMNVGALYEVQPKVGVPFTYTALLTIPGGAHRQMVEVNRAGWANGAEVWPQVSPRPLVFAMTMAEPFVLNMTNQFGALMSGSLDDRRRAYADPSWRAEVQAAWEGKSGFGIPRWDAWKVGESTAHPDLEGRALLDVAAERSTTPLETVLDLALDEPDLMLRMQVVLANGDTDEVAGLLTEEHTTIGLSDAGAHIGQLCDAPQATDFLGQWVRERQVMPLEEAVRKLTGVQADLLGISDRGYLRPGAWADVVVFDPETVAPGPTRRVRDFPADAERLTADQPVGVRHVLVNGEPIRLDGEQLLDARPGQLVRPEPRG
jgi:N-acyl-D-amino-acid deacylase